MQVNFTVPSVVLEHSSLIVDVTCQAGGLAIAFSSQEAAHSALGIWTKHPGIQLVTHTDGCGNSASGQRVYYLTETIRLSGSTIIVSGREVHIEQALVDVTLVWGAYVPPNGGTSHAGASSMGDSSVYSCNVLANYSEGSSNIHPQGSPTSTSVPIASSTSECSNPGASVIDGLPASACGSDFDQNLDDALGYYNVDDNHFTDSLAILAPGTAYADEATKRSLHLLDKRWSIGGVFKSVVNVCTLCFDHQISTNIRQTVKSTVTTVAKSVAKVLPAVIVKAATTVVKAVLTVVNTAFSPSVHVNVPINVGPSASKLKKSPFGPAYQIYQYTVPSNDPKKSKFEKDLEGILDKLLPEDGQPVPGVTFYCVNCGIHGNIKIYGSISFRLLSGITAGSVGMSGNLAAGLTIGVDAFAEYKKKITVARLVHQGVPGFSIPNIITLGPEITLDMTAEFGISAQGQLLAGVTMTWPNINANLDILNPSASSSSGFTPQVNRIFNATGTLTATAALGLPVGLAFGIDLLAGKYSKSIALIDTPAVG